MATEFHRRQYVRANVDLPLNLTAEGEASRHDGVAVDLGAGGMRLETVKELGAGANIELRFRLEPQGREILARARVVLSFFNRQQGKYQHGIAFTAIAREDRAAIDEFVRAKSLAK